MIYVREFACVAKKVDECAPEVFGSPFDSVLNMPSVPKAVYQRRDIPRIEADVSDYT